jgi:hypothetical protein
MMRMQQEDWFRIENRSPFSLSCQQGPKDVESAGAWLRDTNRVGFSYGSIIEPGRTVTVSMMPPDDATRWRTTFLLTKMVTPRSGTGSGNSVSKHSWMGFGWTASVITTGLGRPRTPNRSSLPRRQ